MLLVLSGPEGSEVRGRLMGFVSFVGVRGLVDFSLDGRTLGLCYQAAVAQKSMP